MSLFRLALPLLVAIGGLAAWRANRKQDRPIDDGQKTWRDTSLDDWRRERDELAARERQHRESGVAREDLAQGQGREADTQRTTHTRLGG